MTIKIMLIKRFLARPSFQSILFFLNPSNRKIDFSLSLSLFFFFLQTMVKSPEHGLNKAYFYDYRCKGSEFLEFQTLQLSRKSGKNDKNACAK